MSPFTIRLVVAYLSPLESNIFVSLDIFIWKLVSFRFRVLSEYFVEHGRKESVLHVPENSRTELCCGSGLHIMCFQGNEDYFQYPI
jgi:hypothetical protein